MSIDLTVKLGIEGSNATKQITELKKELKNLDSQMKSVDTNTGNFNKDMQNMATKVDLTKTKINGLQTQLQAYNTKLKDASTRLSNAKAKQAELANSTETTAEEMEKANKAVESATTHYNNMRRGVEQTERALNSANKELQELEIAMKRMPLDNMAKKFESMGNTLKGISSATAPLSLALTGFGTYAVKAAMDFDQSMKNVQAVSGATSDELEALTEKAREMGATTEFTAKEAADALYYMSLAGWDANQSMTGLPAVLNLATAAGMELSLASDIVTDSLTAFGLKAEDASSFCDVLAKTSASSNTTVEMLGEAFKNVAPLAGAMGYNVSEVSLALGLMA